MVSINYWNLVEIFTAISHFGFFCGLWEGPLLLEMECSYSSDNHKECIKSQALNINNISPTVLVPTRHTSIQPAHIHRDKQHSKKKQEILEKTNRLFSFSMTRTAYETTLIVTYVFVAAGKYLPSHCLATIVGYTYIYTEPLPSIDSGLYRHIDRMVIS